MAGEASNWTTLGNNLDAVDDNDSGFKGYINIHESGYGETGGTASLSDSNLINHQMRRECHIWLLDSSTTYTKTFDFPVSGDLTIILNPTKINLGNDPGNCTVKVQGGVTGGSSSYGDLVQLGTTNLDNAVVSYVYDYDANGRAPYMRLSVTQANNVDNTTQPLKIVVLEH